jgi:hypothetical protein
VIQQRWVHQTSIKTTQSSPNTAWKHNLHRTHAAGTASFLATTRYHRMHHTRHHSITSSPHCMMRSRVHTVLWTRFTHAQLDQDTCM